MLLPSAERAADSAVVPDSTIWVQPSGETTVTLGAAHLQQTQLGRNGINSLWYGKSACLHCRDTTSPTLSPYWHQLFNTHKHKQLAAVVFILELSIESQPQFPRVHPLPHICSLVISKRQIKMNCAAQDSLIEVADIN